MKSRIISERLLSGQKTGSNILSSFCSQHSFVVGWSPQSRSAEWLAHRLNHRPSRQTRREPINPNRQYPKRHGTTNKNGDQTTRRRRATNSSRRDDDQVALFLDILFLCSISFFQKTNSDMRKLGASGFSISSCNHSALPFHL